MIGKFLKGASYVARGFKLINTRGIRRYVIIPLLVNVILFSTVIWYGSEQLELLAVWVESYLPGWLDWLTWLLWPLFVLTAMLVVFFIFTPVANLIASPFNGILAEKLEAHLSGSARTESSGWSQLLAGSLTAVANELRKLFYMLFTALPFLLLFLIPGINLIAPFLWLLFGAWMLALEYSDYPMGNHGMRFKDERILLKQHRSLALGFGGTLMLMTMVPGLNFLAMPVGVAGATALWVEQIKPAAEIKAA